MKSPGQKLLTVAGSFVLCLAGIGLVLWALSPSAAQAATPEPDRIATGVAEARAVAATLTAEAPEIDRIATGVAEAKAVAATLTAEPPREMQTCAPCDCPTIAQASEATLTPTVSSDVKYGATRHCEAKAGYATIELRNIVANVKSLNFFADDVQVASLAYGKYGCIYLEDGKYVFQWKNPSEQKQSNARSFTVEGSDAWYSGSKRTDGIRNPYDAWLDVYKPTHTATPSPTASATPTPP